MENILIVEDDIDIHNVIKKVLENENYNVLNSYSGKEALILIENKNIDLILLDLMLPDIAGEEIIKKVKDIPIIVISAKDITNTENAKNIIREIANMINLYFEKYGGVLNNAENYQDDGHLRQYLTTITRNLALNLVTKKETINLDSIKEPSTNDNNNIELILTLKNTLDEDESNIVILKIIYDYNFREIAEDTNSTIGIVQAKYYKALKKLKNHFEGDNLK